MHSRSPTPRDSRKDDARKVFVTNIDGSQPEEEVQSQLRSLFNKYGAVTKLTVKKNKNGLYSFAFVEFDTAEESANAIRELDQFEIYGKRMRVRQDRQSEGCFHCKKTGHFARECPQNRQALEEGDGQRREPRREREDRGRDDRGREDRGRDDRGREDRGRDDRGRDDRYERNERRGHDYRQERGRERGERDHYQRRRRSSRSASRSQSRSRSYSPYERRRRYSSKSRSVSYQRNRHESRHGERSGHGRRYEERREPRRSPVRRRQKESYSRSGSGSAGR